MRKVVGAIALLFLLAFFVLLTPFPGGAASPAAQAENQSAQSQLLLRSAEIADAGEGAAGEGAAGSANAPSAAESGSGKVAVLRLSLFSPDLRNVTAFCSSSPLQKNGLILSFPSVPGTDKNLPAMVAAALSQSGISSRMAGADDALTSQNALIIAPTGAIPLPLLENAEKLQQANSRVVVLQSLAGKAIDADRSISPINGSLPENFRLVTLLPSGAAEAASAAARMAVFLPSSSQVRASASGNFTLAVPINSTSAYCRAIVAQEDGKYRFFDSARLEAAQGGLNGPSALAAGESGIYEFSLSGASEVGRQLRFFIAARSSSGEESRREIAGGKISEGWASRFTLNFTHGGKYVARVIDQFGRVHAAAFIQVPALEVQPASAEGSRYEFLALLDGEPATGAILAQLDNGTPRNYSIRDGKLVIWAAPSPGSHTLHFALGGSKAVYQFTAQQSGAGALFDTYLRFGVPAIIFIAAVFLLLRAGRRSKYSITFPEPAMQDSEAVDVGARSLLEAYSRADRKIGGFSLPGYPHEIAAELGKLIGKSFGEQSVLGCLKKLATQGVFCEHAGAFVPAGAMGGFSVQQLAMLRTIHDIMLERGLRFSRQPVITVRRGELELAIFRGKAGVLEKIGKACRAVAFENSEGLAAFEEELREPGRESARICLALGNGKLVFIAANRAGLEGILP